jgi:CRISPR-associated protein Cmr2
LRSALRQTKNWIDTQPELVRLFGNPKGAEEEFRAGRLECYPTFFYRVGLEIINPHDRARKVGKNPILFECVPAGARGTFSLLYIPFDRIGQDEPETRRQAAEDLQLVTEGLQAMFLTYGFSAKRSSGYGVAEDEIIEGEVRTKSGAPHDLTGKKLSQLAQEVKDVSF